MKAYKPARPHWRTYHDEWSDTPHGSNSVNGARQAVHHNCEFIDNDATRTRFTPSESWVLINDHGNPLHAYFKRGTRSVEFAWSQVKDREYRYNGRVYHLRTIAEVLQFNAQHKTIHGHPLGTEVEIKNLHPITLTGLDGLMVQLAKDAEAAYGEHWQRYVVVKVLTCLPGGLRYAYQVCAAAHKAGIPTMILPRSLDRLRSFRGHHEITYRR